MNTVGSLIDTFADFYLEVFGSYPNADKEGLDLLILKNYFKWALEKQILFWEEKNKILYGIGIAKPTYWGCDWWDLDYYGKSLHLGLYIDAKKDPLTKWRLLSQALERFPNCTEAVWTRNSVHLGELRRDMTPRVTTIERLTKQLNKKLNHER